MSQLMDEEALKRVCLSIDMQSDGRLENVFGVPCKLAVIVDDDNVYVTTATGTFLVLEDGTPTAWRSPGEKVH